MTKTKTIVRDGAGSQRMARAGGRNTTVASDDAGSPDVVDQEQEREFYARHPEQRPNPNLEAMDYGAVAGDDAGDCGDNPQPLVIELESPAMVTCSNLLLERGLTKDQVDYVILNKFARVRQREIAEVLKWTPKKAAAVRRQVDRMLTKIRTAMADTGVTTIAPCPALPQWGSYTRRYFTMDAVSNSFRVCPKPHIGRGRNTKVSRPTTRRFMFLTVEADNTLVANEVAKYQLGKPWSMTEAGILERATELIRSKMLNAAQDAERARVDGLSKTELHAEQTAALESLNSLRAIAEHKRAELAKVRRKLIAKRSDSLRRAAEKIEEELSAIQDDLRESYWSHNLLSEQIQYRDQLARQQAATKAEWRIKADVATRLMGLAATIAKTPGIPSRDMFSGVDNAYQRSLLLHITALLADLGRTLHPAAAQPVNGKQVA